MKQQIVRVTAIKLQICSFLSILCLSAPLREQNSPPTAVFRVKGGVGGLRQQAYYNKVGGASAGRAPRNIYGWLVVES